MNAGRVTLVGLQSPVRTRHVGPGEGSRKFPKGGDAGLILQKMFKRGKKNATQGVDSRSVRCVTFPSLPRGSRKPKEGLEKNIERKLTRAEKKGPGKRLKGRYRKLRR